jgi:hypothetical protein
MTGGEIVDFTRRSRSAPVIATARLGWLIPSLCEMEVRSLVLSGVGNGAPLSTANTHVIEIPI